MAENTFQKASITAETAQRMIAAAEVKAVEMGRPNTPHLQLESAV
jgi:hypothetical protein